MKIKKQWLLSLCILMSAYNILMAAEKMANKVVARVNNKVILMSDFESRAKPIMEEYGKMLTGPDKDKKIAELKENILNQMIDEKLLLQKADKEKIIITEPEVDQGMDEIRARFPGEVEFQNEVSKQGLTETAFRQNVKDQLKVIKLINQNVQSRVSPPTDKDIKKYYDEHSEEMVSPEQVRVRHILIKTSEKTSQETAKKKIDKIYEMAKKDKSEFSALAEKNSEGPTASVGGDLGYFGKGEMVKEFEEAAFALEVGQISKPVKTRFGYHIIKLVGKKSSEKKTFSEVKDKLKNLLYQMNMEAEYEKLLRDLRDQAKIIKTLPKNEK